MIGETAKRLLRKAAWSSGLVISKRITLYAEMEVASVGRFVRHYDVDLLLDIGANAGQYAQMVRHRAGYAGRIISCEPNPELQAGLKQLAASDPKWTILPVAVGDKPGRATLNITSNSEFSSLSRIDHAETGGRFSEFTEIQREVEVEVTTVDALLQTYGSARDKGSTYVKIDVQGLEKSVVAGASGSLPDICGFQLELAFKRIYENSWRFNDAVADMASKGFELTSLFPNNTAPFPELVETDAIFHNKNLPRSNTKPGAASGMPATN